MAWIAKTWSKLLLYIGGIDYRIIGLDNLDPKGSYLFAANHESALDIPLVFAGLPYHIVAVAKIELKRIPIFGWSMMAGGHFFVDRKNRKRAMKSLENAKTSMLKNPRSIIIYPEGTRSNDGSIGPFKKGGLILAIDMDLPVVPVALCGTRECMGDEKFTLKKTTIEMRIGEPLETHGLGYQDRNQLAENVRGEVLRLKSEWEHRSAILN